MSVNEIKASEMAIVQLREAVKFAEEHLSPDAFAKAIAEVSPKDFLTVVHGKLAIMILDK
jgi:hypothetical protein